MDSMKILEKVSTLEFKRKTLNKQKNPRIFKQSEMTNNNSIRRAKYRKYFINYRFDDLRTSFQSFRRSVDKLPTKKCWSSKERTSLKSTKQQIRVYTYENAWKRVKHFMKGLHCALKETTRTDLENGMNNLGIFAENGIDWQTIALACYAISIPLVPIFFSPGAISNEDLVQIINNSDMTILCVDAIHFARFYEFILPNCSKLQMVVWLRENTFAIEKYLSMKTQTDQTTTPTSPSKRNFQISWVDKAKIFTKEDAIKQEEEDEKKQREEEEKLRAKNKGKPVRKIPTPSSPVPKLPEAKVGAPLPDVPSPSSPLVEEEKPDSATTPTETTIVIPEEPKKIAPARPALMKQIKMSDVLDLGMKTISKLKKDAPNPTTPQCIVYYRSESNALEPLVFTHDNIMAATAGLFHGLAKFEMSEEDNLLSGVASVYSTLTTAQPQGSFLNYANKDGGKEEGDKDNLFDDGEIVEVQEEGEDNEEAAEPQMANLGETSFINSVKKVFSASSNNSIIRLKLLEHVTEILFYQNGGSIAFSTTNAANQASSLPAFNLLSDCRVFKPTMICAFPSLIEQFYKIMVKKNLIIAAGPKKQFFEKAFQTKKKLMFSGDPHTGGLKAKIYEVTTFQKLKKEVGGKLRMMISSCGQGSASLNPEIEDKLRVCFETYIVESYGTVASAGVGTLQLPYDSNDFCHGGAPIPCNEIRLLPTFPGMENEKDGNNLVPKKILEDNQKGKENFAAEIKKEAEKRIKKGKAPRPEIPVNTVGEIYIRGCNIPIQTYKGGAPKAMDEEGWYKTGDLGVLNYNGSITFIDDSTIFN